MFLNPTKVTEVLQNLKRKCGGASVLAHIINNIVVQGSCPYQFEAAEVCPVLRKRSKNDMNKYRLIALIFNLAKIFEKLIQSFLQDRIQVVKVNGIKSHPIKTNLGVRQ